MEKWLTEISSAMIVAIASTFMGGIVGFYISQLTEKTKRNRKYWRNHWGALVRLEYQLNEMLDSVSVNSRTATVAIDAVSRKDGAAPIVWNLPHPLRFDDLLFTGLLREELINDVFSFSLNTRRLNNDIEMVSRSYSEVRSGFMTQNIVKELYRTILSEFQANLGELKKAYGLVDERTLLLLARTRATLAKDKTYKGRFLQMPKLVNVSDHDIQSELKTLKEEIAETQRCSRDEIKRHLG